MSIKISLTIMKSVFKAAEENFDTDESTIYGLYFFAGGGKIDQGRSEVVDKNDDYSAA